MSQKRLMDVRPVTPWLVLLLMPAGLMLAPPKTAAADGVRLISPSDIFRSSAADEPASLIFRRWPEQGPGPEAFDSAEEERLPVLSPVRRGADDPAVLFRGQSPADEFVVPLVHRRAAMIQPVRNISVPNPLALLGNPRQWRGRFRGAYGSNFGGRTMLYGNYILTSGVPIALDTEFAYRQDEKPRLADRRFWNGDFNLVYHLKQIRYVVFRMGVGANWLNDGETTEVGFNSTYGFDIRLKKPWYVTTTVDWGRLGSDQLLHWQLSGGLDFGRFELFLGYDFFDVGNLERKLWLAGAGIWF